MKTKSLAISLTVLPLLIGFHALLWVWPIGAAYEAYFFIARPLVYIAAGLAIFFLMGGQFATRSVKNNTFLICAIAAVLYLLLLFLSGLFGGFAGNRLVPSGGIFFRNLWSYGTVFAAMEIMRLIMVRRIDNKHIIWFGILLSVVFSFAQVENLRYAFGGGANWADTIATLLLPVLIVNFFLTYAAQNGTLLGLLTFRLAVSMAPVLLPIVPNADKFLLVIFLCVTVIVGYIMLDKFRFDETQKLRRDKKKYRWKGYIAPAVILAALIIFGLGVLPVKPLAVASHSMTGVLNKGDSVIIIKVTPEEAERKIVEGQVIEFSDGKRSIAHRVVEIGVDPGGQTYYITKGDANGSNDSKPVYTDDVLGIAQFSLPYVGWPAVWLSELFR